VCWYERAKLGPDWGTFEMAQNSTYTDKAMKDHAKTYTGFLAMMKYGTGFIVLVLLGMLLFLYN